MKCPCGKGELPPLSREPKVGDEVLVRMNVYNKTNFWIQDADGVQSPVDKVVAILPTPESEEKCSCGVGLSGQPMPHILNKDCPIHKPKRPDAKKDEPRTFCGRNTIQRTKNNFATYRMGRCYLERIYK